MLALLSLCVVIMLFDISECQQCRYVCDENKQSFVHMVGPVGPQGVRGLPGRMGPRGYPGRPGRNAVVTKKETFEDKVTDRLAELESKMTLLLLPETCHMTSQSGYIKLRSGEMTYCDGGWTVFQRRFDGSVNFQRGWHDYKIGFGNITTEFWIGLEKIHCMTYMKGCKLRVDLWSFHDDHAFAEYSSFSVEAEGDLYRLHVGGYSGTAGDSLSRDDEGHDNMAFSTIDRDNDRNNKGNCASNQNGPSGGWWFNNCFRAQLNALWGSSQGPWHNIVWRSWLGENVAIKSTMMKLRCN
uniref:ficolin-1-like n=1 Tax=Ciona intestinalis TaxID=7719 RepID=UPI00089DD2B7|nr:ficolin-1-like [Ciona intestinalis]|eukprot:XP_004226298.2 ficolin-1-like [Ciona intestinalis]